MGTAAVAITAITTPPLSLQGVHNQIVISESGYFEAEYGQALILSVAGYIASGAVDLFLIGPDGEDGYFRITSRSAVDDINPVDTSLEAPLTEGLWQFNAFGIFRGDSASIAVTIAP